ncbi:hypothetical protein Tco_0689366 [Tanacetum coccineum]
MCGELMCGAGELGAMFGLMYLSALVQNIMFAVVYCKKQTVVATSTTEAEYVAAASCCGQVLWIQNQLLDYGYNFMNTVINIDNNNLLTKGFDAGRFQYLVSSSGPRCQDTILGDVDAQTRFETTSKQSNDPPLSRGYTLESGKDRGTDCLPTAIIFEELAQMGSQKKQSRRKQRKDTAFTQEETQQDDSVPTPSNDPPLSGLKRLRKVGMSRRVESLEDKDSLGDHEDASKQGRSIEDIDKNADVSLVNNTQGRSDNEGMFDINDLYSDEVNVDMPVGEKQEQSAKEIEVDTSVEDIDENLARSLQAQLEAELIEEERLARKKKEEANIALIESWDNTQAMMEADFELAQRLQTEEQGKITIEERSRLFVELMNKRKKHFAKLRAEEKRRKPPTKAQKRNQMSTYLKNMGRYKHNQLKSKSNEEI